MAKLGENVLEWNVGQLAEWLRAEGMNDCVKAFSAKQIGGRHLVTLTNDDIKSLHISHGSKKKLMKTVEKYKSKKKAIMDRMFNDSRDGSMVQKLNSRKPSSFCHDDDDEDATSDDGWGSEEWDSDPEEESDSDAGEYLEPEQDDSQRASLQREVASVPTGLVAQLRAGIAESLHSGGGGEGYGPPAGGYQTTEVDQEEEDIYDVPPEEEELYEDPSDSSGGAVVVRPPPRDRIIRTSESERGEYLVTRDTVEAEPQDMYEAPLEGEDISLSSQALGGTHRFIPTKVVQGGMGQPSEDMYEVPEAQEEEEYEIPEGQAAAPPPRPPKKLGSDPSPKHSGKAAPRGQPSPGPQPFGDRPSPQHQRGQVPLPKAHPSPGRSKPFPTPQQQSRGPQHGVRAAPEPGGKNIPPTPVNRGPSPGLRPSPINRAPGPGPAPLKKGPSAGPPPGPAMKKGPSAGPLPGPGSAPMKMGPSAGTPPGPKVGTSNRGPHPGARPPPTNRAPLPSPASRGPPEPSPASRAPARTNIDKGGLSGESLQTRPPVVGSRALQSKPGDKECGPSRPLRVEGSPSSQEERIPARRLPVGAPQTTQRRSEPPTEPAPPPRPPKQSPPAQAPSPQQPTLPKKHSVDKKGVPLPTPPSSSSLEQSSASSIESGSADEPVIPLQQLQKVTGKRSLPPPPRSSTPKTPLDIMMEAPWFQGTVDRKKVERGLKACKKDGAFLVRNSSQNPQDYSMSLLYRNDVRHLRIPHKDGKYVLGDSGLQKFDTIVDMVSYYRQNAVDLKAGGSTKLTIPCPIYS